MACGTEFAFRRAVLGGKTSLPLLASDVKVLQAAILDINEMLDVEQKFDVLYANFVELEQELASRTIRQAYHSFSDVATFYDDKQALNRRMVNILTAARLYVDQLSHHATVFFRSEPNEAENLKALLNKEYDEHFAYRLMEALRNYTQHRGLPLQGMTYNAQWLESGEPGHRLEYNVAMHLRPEQLRADGKFKATVLEELAKLGQSVDIKRFVRQYIECIGRVHMEARSILGKRVDQAIARLKVLKDEFLAICGEEHPDLGLCIVKQHEHGTYDIVTYYPRDSLEYLEVLQGRNSTLQKLGLRVTTSQPIR